ncbi:MAG: glycosyltransferase family 4 protein [Cyclonatronaceae bacterium]
MRAKKIGMVLNSFYPDDIRVFKEAEALINAGHEVFLLCYRRLQEKEYDEVDGMNIRRVYIGQSKISEGLWDMLNACFFYHPAIGKALTGFVEQFNIDVLHVHDLPLAGTVESVARKKKIKWVLDLHENYPEGLKIWFKWRKSPLIRLKNRIFFSYNRWLKFERNATQKCDVVIAVVDEMKDRLIQKHHILPGKIHVITNTESKSFLDQKIVEDIYGELKDEFILLYAGGLGPHRGVDTVIEAMAHLKNRKDISLVIVGTGNRDIVQSLKQQAADLGVAGRVHFKGYQPFELFHSFMSHASVNVIPHNDNSHTNHTIPHKLFQSMMTGRPVLVSTCKPLKRTVEQARSGLVFEAGNAKDCAAKIEVIYNDREMAARMGANGRKATLEGSLNWESTGKELAALYDLL